nr:hypothetical protein [Tanacetum cinerariifolium]
LFARLIEEFGFALHRGVDRAREPVVRILWGLVNSANVNYANLIWEDFSSIWESSDDDKTESYNDSDNEDNDDTNQDVMKKNPIDIFNSSSTTSGDPAEYELKHQLYEKMFQTAEYLNHDSHRALYDALQESMRIDELQARYEPTQL